MDSGVIQLSSTLLTLYQIQKLITASIVKNHQCGHGLAGKTMVHEVTQQGSILMKAQINGWGQVQALDDSNGRVPLCRDNLANGNASDQ